MRVERSSLAALGIFRGLGEEEIDRLADSLHPKDFARGAHILSAEQPGEAVYIITAGTVRVFVTRADGHEHVLAVQGAGDVVGEMSLVDRAGRSANVVALEACSSLWMGRLDFQAACKENPLLTDNVMQLLSTRLRLANDLIVSLTSLNVTGRVARQLLSLAERYGVQGLEGGLLIPLRLTQGDLAGLVGASRERVNHAMVWLERSRVISLGRRFRITVLDAAALADLCR